MASESGYINPPGVWGPTPEVPSHPEVPSDHIVCGNAQGPEASDEDLQALYKKVMSYTYDDACRERDAALAAGDVRAAAEWQAKCEEFLPGLKEAVEWDEVGQGGGLEPDVTP